MPTREDTVAETAVRFFFFFFRLVAVLLFYAPSVVL